MTKQFRRVAALCPIFLLVTFVSGAAANDLSCPSSTTLEGLATCIRNQMPQSGSNGFVAPRSAEQSD